MHYTINSNLTYNVAAKQNNLSAPYICMQVASKSNRIPAFTPALLGNRVDFRTFFPDKDKHISLEKGYILADSGYNLYVQNIYQASDNITLRVFPDNAFWFDQAVSYDNALISFAGSNVIRIDFSKVKYGDYLLIELNNSLNTTVLLWVGNPDDPLPGGFVSNYINYWKESRLDPKKGMYSYQAIDAFNDKLPLGINAIEGEISSVVYLVYQEGFSNIGNTSFDNVTYTKDKDSYIYLTANDRFKIFDIISKYKTDESDIEISISKQASNLWQINIISLIEGNIDSQEVFVGVLSSNDTFYPNVLDELKKSTVVNITVYNNNPSTLPVGSWKLSNEKIESGFDINSVITPQSFIDSFKYFKYDLDKFNLYYDSHVLNTTYQELLYNKFGGYQKLGLMTYIGKHYGYNITYFRNEEIVRFTTKYHTADLLLALLMVEQHVDGVIRGVYSYKDLGEDYEYPTYIPVNRIDPDVIYSNKLIVTHYNINNRVIDIRDALIGPLLVRAITTYWSNDVSSIQLAIADVREFLSRYLNYESDIQLLNIETTGDLLKVYIQYGTRLIIEVKNLNINTLIIGEK